MPLYVSVAIGDHRMMRTDRAKAMDILKGSEIQLYSDVHYHYTPTSHAYVAATLHNKTLLGHDGSKSMS